MAHNSLDSTDTPAPSVKEKGLTYVWTTNAVRKELVIQGDTVRYDTSHLSPRRGVRFALEDKVYAPAIVRAPVASASCTAEQLEKSGYAGIYVLKPQPGGQ